MGIIILKSKVNAITVHRKCKISRLISFKNSINIEKHLNQFYSKSS